MKACKLPTYDDELHPDTKRGDVVVDASRRFRRVNVDNVFAYLGQKLPKQSAPALSRGMQAAGNNMVDLYAERMGLAGLPDRDCLEPVIVGRVNHESAPSRLESAGKRWRCIMAEFGSRSVYPAMLEALCALAVTPPSVASRGDSTAVTGQKWRAIVRHYTGIKSATDQVASVRLMCGELAQILESESRAARKA